MTILERLRVLSCAALIQVQLDTVMDAIRTIEQLRNDAISVERERQQDRYMPADPYGY